jgi:hypothetical protein
MINKVRKEKIALEKELQSQKKYYIEKEKLLKKYVEEEKLIKIKLSDCNKNEMLEKSEEYKPVIKVTEKRSQSFSAFCYEKKKFIMRSVPPPNFDYKFNYFGNFSSFLKHNPSTTNVGLNSGKGSLAEGTVPYPSVISLCSSVEHVLANKYSFFLFFKYNYYNYFFCVILDIYILEFCLIFLFLG